MHKLTVTLLLSVSLLTGMSPLANGASTSNPVSADKRAELLKAREAVWRAWFANDEAALEKVLPDDTIAINNGEEKWETRADVLKSAADSVAAGTRLVRLEFPRTEIQRFGDVAILYSLFTTDTETNGQHTITSGRSTEVFLFRDGRWLNTGWHADSGK
jgi:ketosteroid isomerase-like protein